MSRRTRERFSKDREVIRFLNEMTVDSWRGKLSVSESRDLTPRSAWIAWLEPYFADNDSAYFTGTYNDVYGLSHGLMLVRNVQKDFERFCEWARIGDRDYVCGVEPHRERDILHLHAVIEGPFNEPQRRMLQSEWDSRSWTCELNGVVMKAPRGFARVLPVLDRCESYVTKYALKNDSDAFAFKLSRLGGVSSIDAQAVQGELWPRDA